MSNIGVARKGFTIIEALAAIAVFGLIWGAILVAIMAIYRTQGYTMQQSMAINEARRGVDIMAKEIREARYGENGAYPIGKGGGKEFIFYSDVDNDGAVEKVRYFLARVRSDVQTQECVSYSQGGSCNVSFDDFLTDTNGDGVSDGILKSAQIRVSSEGYYGNTGRYTEFYADGVKLANICQTGCSQCAGAWQGTQTFDVTGAASDGSIQFIMDGTNSVRAQCSWLNPNHSMKAWFELMFTEEVPSSGDELRRGVTEPVGSPVTYPEDQEQARIITSYIRNEPPIFFYYDKDGNQILTDPSILQDTKMMKLYMVINVDPNRAPGDFIMEQYVNLRNLREED